MGNLKKFVGDYAYSYIKNIAVDQEKLRKALVTPQNARNVFSELDEFQIKSICAEISANDTFGTIRETTQEEIIEDFKKAGYNTVIFDDEEKIAECKKYYAAGEVICTYNNLSGRMSQYHMLVAIKKDIDKIQRSKTPKREDEYGTSILNIQIAKNGSHMSIKNRYNHTVSECDSTLNNNLDLLVPGLQAKVLGYYNIASLNKNKTYYRNIAKINGVYLKYVTEVENVYFGNFVLDSKNGVRFADNGRYYVNTDRDNICVLDFHDKKVIKLFGERNQISKGTLLTRAMKENLLYSGNKERINELNIVFENALQELLQCRRKALQFIACGYGYDFQKPFKVTGLLGKFTANSIKKITGSNSGILLICKGTEVCCVELNTGKFEVEVPREKYKYSISNYYTKYDFEEDRKSGKLGVFIIQQDAKYKRKVKRTSSYSYCYSNSRSDEFDKSGCNITEARQALKYRLDNYKADKRKREVDSISYEADLKEIKEMFQILKKKLVLRLSEAKTSEDYKNIESVFNYSFTCMVRDMEDFETKVMQNKFRTVKEATNSIANLKEKIKEKIKILEGSESYADY
nr:MAG TPA: hypothetical protein [Caudoviricetes sp.]